MCFRGHTIHRGRQSVTATRWPPKRRHRGNAIIVRTALLAFLIGWAFATPAAADDPGDEPYMIRMLAAGGLTPKWSVPSAVDCGRQHAASPGIGTTGDRVLRARPERSRQGQSARTGESFDDRGRQHGHRQSIYAWPWARQLMTQSGHAEAALECPNSLPNILTQCHYPWKQHCP